MEHFDKYIKEKAKNQLPTPPGLSWEEMNFQLPRKSKRRYLGFWWILLGVVLGVSITLGYLSFSKEPSKIVETGDQNVAHEKSLNVINEDAKFLNSENKSTNQKDSEVMTQEAVVKRVNKKVSNSAKSKGVLIEATENTKIVTGLAVSDKVKEQSLKNHKTFDENIIVDRSEHTDGQSNLNEISRLELLAHGLLSIEEIELPQLYVNVTKKSDIERLPLALSLTTSSLRSDEFFSGTSSSDVINAANSVGFGWSFSMGIRKQMANNYYLFSELAFQKFKTVFQYSENLGTVDGPLSFQLVTSYRNVYHNNESSYVGIRYGLGKDFDICDRLGFSASFSMLSAYRYDFSGKNLNEQASIYSIDKSQVSSALVTSLVPEIGVFYEFKEFKLSGLIGLQRAVNSAPYTSESELRVSPRALSLSVGIERIIN